MRQGPGYIASKSAFERRWEKVTRETNPTTGCGRIVIGDDLVGDLKRLRAAQHRLRWRPDRSRSPAGPSRLSRADEIKLTVPYFDVRGALGSRIGLHVAMDIP
jgi:hypothetical protein